MNKPAETDHPIHDILKNRWSPRAFSDQPIPSDLINSIFEAARWAPSCFNEQPWRFIFATKSDKTSHERLANCLVDANGWAKAAPVLIVTIAASQFARNGKPNRHAWHDLGLAVGNLAAQATEHGLLMHQMAGFQPDKAVETLSIPESYEAVTMIALGYPGNPDDLPENLRERELAPRSRKPLSEFLFEGTWQG